MPDTIKNKLLQKQLDGTIVTVQDSLPFEVPYNLLEDSKTSDNPSTVPIEVLPSNKYDGMRKVIVPAIHDGNLRPENIIQGVTILGVEGTATTDNLQHNKTINPPLHTTTFDPNPGFRGMEHVTINGVLDSEPALVPENIKKNVSIYGVVGKYDGNPPPYDGTTDMYVGDETGIQAGDLSVYDEDLIPENIREGITIFGITGNYGGGSSVITTKTVNPATDTFPITPSSGSDGISSVSLTTSSTNTLKKENIRDGITIFGVEGNYSGESANIQPVTGIVLSANQTTITNPSNIDGMSSVSFKLNDSLKSIIKAGETILGVTGEYHGYEGSDNLYVGKDTDVQNGDYYINDSNLKPENIKENVVIFGIKGTYTGSGGDPTGDENLYVGNDSKDSSISNGDYIIKDSELISSNIKSGVTIFGVEGTYDSFNNTTDIFNNGRWYSSFGYAELNLTNGDDASYNAQIDYSNNTFYIKKPSGTIRVCYVFPKGSLSVPSGCTSIKINVSQIYSGASFKFYVLSESEDWLTDPDDSITLDSVREFTYSIPTRYLNANFSVCLRLYSSGSSTTSDKLISISSIKFS